MSIRLGLLIVKEGRGRKKEETNLALEAISSSTAPFGIHSCICLFFVLASLSRFLLTNCKIISLGSILNIEIMTGIALTIS